MTHSTLAGWLAYLEQLHPQAIDMGLERVRAVADQLGLQRPARRVITVTGTNGKGSTCAFLASLLRAQGLRVGVYSSPHLRRYNERICIDGQEASDAALCQAFAQIEQARGETSLTYFEVGTLAAFSLFQAADLDVAVLEVGLGGRLDAVNLIDPDLAIVTSVGLDHVEWLGDSRDSVAREKAGIFRAGVPIVCGDPEPPLPLLEAAQALQAPLRVRGRDYDLSIQADGWQWQGQALDGSAIVCADLPLLNLPMENAACALQALVLLDIAAPSSSWAAALRSTQILGRFDRRVLWREGKSLHLMLDVGHNPHAACYLARYLQQHPPKGRWRAVFGLLMDKDLHGVLSALLPVIQDWAVAPLDTPRSHSAATLASALNAKGARVSRYASIAQALDAQWAQADQDDEILVFGSFYCVADGLNWLDQQVLEKTDDVAG